jgi:glycosyltransferase involved in cell wall biosynthesis
MSPEQLSDLYNEVHVVLIPSQLVETGPLVFHEAIACGCSVITTPIGGNKYLGEHYKRSSTFFEIDNYLDLAKKISNFKYEFLVHPINSIKNHFLNVLPSDLT